MLEQLFKRHKLTSNNDAVRLRAVGALDPSLPESEAILLSCARKDSSVDVRRAAVAAVHNPQLLVEFLEDEVLSEPALLRIVDLIEPSRHGELLADLRVCKAYLLQASSTELMGLLDQLTDPTLLAELAVKVRGQDRDRLFQHPVLRTEGGLSILEKTSRNKDKACNRHARVLLEAVKQARARYKNQNKRLIELDQALVRAIAELKAEPSNAVSRARIEKLTDARGQVTKDLCVQIDVLSSTLSDVTFPDPPESPLEETTLPIDEGGAGDDEWASRLQLFADLIAQSGATDLLNTWSDITAAWSAVETPSANPVRTLYARLDETMARLAISVKRLQQPPWSTYASPELLVAASYSKEAVEASKAWLKTWRDAQQSLAWPAEIRPEEVLLIFKRDEKKLVAQLAQFSELTSNAQNELADTLAVVVSTLDAGHYQDAVSAIKRARALRDDAHLPLREQQNVDRHISQLSARLRDLKDWQKYATLPKRQDLIDQLHQLTQAPQAPVPQAAALKHLREQWRTLGNPTSADERVLQETFNTLAEQAYEPCRVYYAEQDKVRAGNLAARQTLCETLASYIEKTDWEKADIKAAEHIMRTAREEWRAYHPCERKRLKPVQARFEALQNELYTHIKEEWDRNIQRKQDIVARAEGLLQLEGSDEQADRAKDLQQEWKAVGTTPRSVDQRLWRAFRKACDEIFEQRKAAYDAQRVHTEKLYTDLQAHIESFEQLTDQSEQSTQPSERELEVFNSHIDTLLQQVKPSRPLTQRITNVRKRYRALLIDAKRQSREDKVRYLLDQDLIISQAETARTPIEPTHALFKNRNSSEPVESVVLEAEIAADIQSPKADQQARIALQVDLMNQGIRLSEDTDPMTFLPRWCAIPKPDIDDDLPRRFAAALLKLVDRPASASLRNNS